MIEFMKFIHSWKNMGNIYCLFNHIFITINCSKEITKSPYLYHKAH